MKFLVHGGTSLVTVWSSGVRAGELELDIASVEGVEEPGSPAGLSARNRFASAPLSSSVFLFCAVEFIKKRIWTRLRATTNRTVKYSVGQSCRKPQRGLWIWLER